VTMSGSFLTALDIYGRDRTRRKTGTGLESSDNRLITVNRRRARSGARTSKIRILQQINLAAVTLEMLSVKIQRLGIIFILDFHYFTSHVTLLLRG
jgi:hypothetical protein